MSIMDSPPEGPTDWGPTRTSQSAKAECDINSIMRRVEKTGQLTHISAAIAQYRDVSGLEDLHGMMNAVADANSLFEELPAEIRKLCHHNPRNFLPFIDNPENNEQCIKLGLLPKPEKKTDPPAIIVPRDIDSLKPVETKPAAAVADGSVQGGE